MASSIAATATVISLAAASSSSNSSSRNSSANNILNTNKYYSPMSKSNNGNQSSSTCNNNFSSNSSNNENNSSNSNSIKLGAEGIYVNARFMNACYMIMGCQVSLKTKANETFQGVLATFSPDCDIVLECCHKVDSKNEVVICGRSLPKKSEVKKRFFERENIVEFTVLDVDTQFAAKTSESNNNNNQQQRDQYCGKELEPFVFDDDDDYEYSTNSDDENHSSNNLNRLNNLELNSGDSSSGGGWCAEDMLMINQTKYGYKSTYNSDLPEYTMAIEKDDSEDFRRREKRAEKLANEIESSAAYKRNVDKELSDDEEEEEKFSAVVRPSKASSSSKKQSSSNFKHHH